MAVYRRRSRIGRIVLQSLGWVIAVISLIGSAAAGAALIVYLLSLAVL